MNIICTQINTEDMLINIFRQCHSRYIGARDPIWSETLSDAVYTRVRNRDRFCNKTYVVGLVTTVKWYCTKALIRLMSAGCFMMLVQFWDRHGKFCRKIRSESYDVVV